MHEINNPTCSIIHTMPSSENEEENGKRAEILKDYERTYIRMHKRAQLKWWIMVQPS